jgi:hypothetical protein
MVAHQVNAQAKVKAQRIIERLSEIPKDQFEEGIYVGSLGVKIAFIGDLAEREELTRQAVAYNHSRSEGNDLLAYACPSVDGLTQAIEGEMFAIRDIEGLYTTLGKSVIELNAPDNWNIGWGLCVATARQFSTAERKGGFLCLPTNKIKGILVSSQLNDILTEVCPEYTRKTTPYSHFTKKMGQAINEERKRITRNPRLQRGLDLL